MKIGVVTTSRSEYSLNRWVIKGIIEDKDLELQLLVGGSHFSKTFGNTFTEIEEDNIKNYYKIEFLLDSDTPQALSKSIGVATISIAQIFERDRPDFLLINGDRYELFAFVIPAILFKIPIGHIGGGEVTEGAIDDRIRHSLTKLSHLHFVSCKEYAQNIRLLGEEKWRIHIVGAEGIENIIRLGLFDKNEILNKIGLDLDNPTILISFHPATEENSVSVEEQIDSVLKALDRFKGLQYIFTAPGAEVGSNIVIEKIKSFVHKHKDKSIYVENLGGKMYLSVLKNCKCIVGNSSSGIIEAPFLKVPTLNIGNRQKGRVRAKSVIDVAYNSEEIYQKLKTILTNRDYVLQITSGEYPFGDGKVSDKVIRIIKKELKNPNLLSKKLDFDTRQCFW